MVLDKYPMKKIFLTLTAISLLTSALALANTPPCPFMEQSDRNAKVKTAQTTATTSASPRGSTKNGGTQ